MDQKYHMSQSNCKQAGECGGTDGIIGEHSVFVIGICFTKGNPPVWLRPFTGGYWPARASLAALLPRWWRIHLQCKRLRFDPWVGKIPWRREWLPIPVFLPGESQGQGSLVGCRLWGHTVRHDWSDLAAATCLLISIQAVHRDQV